MPNFIVIESKKASEFNTEASTVLEAKRFIEIHNGTFSGGASASSVAQDLKNLESYKKNKSSAGIKIYYGNLSSL